jgi:hypothetical protein
MKRLLIAGVIVTLLGIVGKYIAEALFVASAISEWISTIGLICFWGFLPALYIGPIVILISLVGFGVIIYRKSKINKGGVTA